MSKLTEFASYIKENAKPDVVTGTYSALWLSPSSAKSLFDFYKPFIKKDREPASSYHITITYSKFVADIKFRVEKMNVILDPRKFQLRKFDDKILVLEVPSVALQVLHSNEEKLGAVWAFPSYIPHITLSTNFPGSIDNLPVPTFPIRCSKYKSEPLKEDWS